MQDNLLIGIEEPCQAVTSAGASEMADVMTMIQPLSLIVSRLGSIKRRYGFDLDEIFIIVACGLINLAGARQQLPFVQPANISSIAEYVRMPRETVRRKLQGIENKGLVCRLSGGYLFTNLAEWAAIVGALAAKPGGRNVGHQRSS